MAEAAQTSQSYKLRRQDHVSNLTGGSVWEINVLCTVAPAAVLVWSVLQSRIRFFESSNPLALPVDLLLNVGALLAAVTVYADSSLVLLALLVLPAIALCAATPAPSFSSPGRSRLPATLSSGAGGTSKLPSFPLRPYLTAYRGGMMIITALCILAVDFDVFPRRFAKVETWGTSLMDVGVGSFVFSGGLVSAKSALKAYVQMHENDTAVSGVSNSNSYNNNKKTEKQGSPQTHAQTSLIIRLTTALRASFPLLVLGLIRLYSVKSLDYAEHVTEYGVHWNFFFTLGFIPIGMALAEPLLAALPAHLPAHLLLGLLITLVHGLALRAEATGLLAWVLRAPRVGLLSQNREGLVSFFGYLAIFLLGRETGSVVLPRQTITGLGALLSGSRLRPGSSPPPPSSSSSPRVHRRNTVLLLAALSAAYAALAWVFAKLLVEGSAEADSPVSRRLANPPYVLWIAAFNHMHLFMYALVETVLFPGVHAARNATDESKEAARATSAVLDAYNAGGLAIFLVANLGTGLVNLTVDTLDAGPLKAMIILLAYMSACTAVALALNRFGLKLKL